MELQARQAIDVYDILTQAFNIDVVADKMYVLFKKKEALEIQRIHNMVGFFESDVCISKQLAEYFGEYLEKNAVGIVHFVKAEKPFFQTRPN